MSLRNRHSMKGSENYNTRSVKFSPTMTHNSLEHTNVISDGSTNQAVCFLIQHQLEVLDVFDPVSKLLYPISGCRLPLFQNLCPWLTVVLEPQQLISDGVF